MMELFAFLKNSSYLCIVRNDYPVTFRVGAGPYRHRPI